MCKEQVPLSTAKYLGAALSLSPVASTPMPTPTPTPEPTEPNPGRTPEEIALFHNTFLTYLARSGCSSVSAEDRAEMAMLGIPAIPDDLLAWARGMVVNATESAADRRRAHLMDRLTQFRMAWFLDDDLHTEEPETHSANNDDDDDENDDNDDENDDNDDYYYYYYYYSSSDDDDEFEPGDLPIEPPVTTFPSSEPGNPDSTDEDMAGESIASLESRIADINLRLEQLREVPETVRAIGEDDDDVSDSEGDEGEEE